MSNQLQITGGAKVRNLEGVLTGTTGVVSSLGINVPNGIPQLDTNGKILVSQLPNSVMEYLGTWDAATNTPTLVNGTGNAGDVYLCSVAGTVNFGAGPISFVVSDQVIYSGTIWQKASGTNGTVTSISVTESGDALSITGSPVTTSGTINIGFAGTSAQYVAGDGSLITFPALTGYVPYTGATSDVDLGTFSLNAKSLHIKGVGGNGHLGLKHQSATPTGSTNESLLFADVNGDFGWQNDNLYLTTLSTHANTANRTYTFPNASGTVALNNIDNVFTAEQTFSAPIDLNNALNLGFNIAGVGIGSSQLGLYATKASTTSNLTMYDGDTGFYARFAFNNTSNKIYTLPSTSGTLALTSDIPTISATAPISYSSGVISISQATTSTNGYLSSTDWNTFNGKQAQINGTGFVKASGTTISYDNSTYLTTSAAASTYLPLTGGTLTGALNGTSATFSGTLTVNGDSSIFNGGTANNLNNYPLAIANTKNLVFGSPSAAQPARMWSGGIGANSSENISIYAYNDLNIYTGSGLGNRLTIASTGAATFSSSVTANRFIVNGTNGNSGQIIQQGDLLGTAGTNLLFQSSTGNSIGFLTNGGTTFNMFINTSGNVGIGTTSPVSVTNQTSLTINGTSVGRLDLSAGGSSNTAGMYATSAGGTVFSFGDLPFLTGASTTEKMRITSGGNVLIGTTTNLGSELNVNNTIRVGVAFGSQANITFGDSGTPYWTVGRNGGSGNFTISSYATTAMTIIPTSGNVGIGTSSPQVALDVINSGTYQLRVATGTGSYSNGKIYFGGYATGDPYYYGTIGWDQSDVTMRIGAQCGNGSGGIAFYTAVGTAAQTEKMRITSGGNVGIGMTGRTNSKLGIRGVDQSSSNYGIIIDNAVTDLFLVRNDGLINTGNATLSPYNFTTGTGANMVVDSSGYLYRSTSSLKYKTNVTDYDKGLDIINKIRPVYYNSKNNGNTLFAGLIAEDIHELGLTEFVQYAEDGTPDALSYSNMVALLIKGMQEQQKQIEELKAKIK